MTKLLRVWLLLAAVTFLGVLTTVQGQKTPKALKYQPQSKLEQELTKYILENEQNIDLEYIIRQIVADDEHLFKDTYELITTHLENVGKTSRFEDEKCDLCLELAPVIDSVLKNDKLVDFAYVIAGASCVLSGLISPRVCVLGIQEWGPTVLYIADKYVLTPDEVCGVLFGDDCADPSIHQPNWTLNFPSTPRPQYVPPPQPPQGVELHKVLHLTDIHVDLFYSDGSNAQCEDPMCCRDIDGEPISYLWAAGKYGSLAYCDSPVVTVENLLAKLSQEHFDYVLVTGDLPAHDVYNQTMEQNLNITKWVNSLLRKYFGNVTLLQAVGNHESCPVDLFVPDYMDSGESAHPMSWLYDVLVEEWSQWLPNSTFDSIRKGGYWAWEFMPGLKVISLNGAYGQTADWYSRVNNSDFSGMLQFMVDELQECEDRNIKAWIISHHREFTLPYYKNMYDKIMQRYVSTITGWFNGHTHTDGLTVYYDDTIKEGVNTPVLTAFTAPSVTTYSNANMGYRIYYVDSKREDATFFVADYTTYYLNVTKAKMTGNIEWEFEYRVKEAFNMTGTLPTDFDDMLTRMSSTTSLAESYIYFEHKSAANVTCDVTCAQNKANGLKHTFDPNPGQEKDQSAAQSTGEEF
ncbi:sphingomyelin phosphodiesterase-like [Convolutriloba macropyga]|uniref:sphingomyelin phosphodiesterase-like n=1 Tax=Convolutriloba macropyga TaxID=536237 RepID=UPI003F5215F7